MPKRTDINKILIVGAGPIVIGQACEFDYSGVQACKALKEEGYKVILINSNPATIMTDPELADKTFIEPITVEFVEKIIKLEKPDAILPTMGGQTAINISLELHNLGILKKYNVEMIGAKPQSINLAEDRELFKKAMSEIGLESPKSNIIRSNNEAITLLKHIKLPVIIRPSYTLGGSGGGIARTTKEFFNSIINGLNESPNHQVLIEESVIGWKEFEMEVIRDKNDNCIIVCSIENLDPMGVHTGDSITIAPALTLTDKEYQLLRNSSIKVLRKIGVDTGGSNVQFAINPLNGKILIIEMNPRVSRSSALASKATGFPIAKIAAKLAVGYTLDELSNDITKVTPASFEPTIDYIVTKIPRFSFEKFSTTDGLLTTSMQSVGEVMSFGRSFCESIQKGLSSLETGLNGLNKPKKLKEETLYDIEKNLIVQSPERILYIAEALRKNFDINKISKLTGYDEWFIEQIEIIIRAEKNILNKEFKLQINSFFKLKNMGYSDNRISELSNIKLDELKEFKKNNNIKPIFKRVDTCAGEFKSFTPYLYSTYSFEKNESIECESETSNKNKVIILGGGPNRIGQGIEFDYCCVHAVFALKEMGYETIMINCNPETVSTDYDTADRLYFEPLTPENVKNIIDTEKQNGKLLGTIIQFGGQTPINISKEIEKDIKILGTSTHAIDLAEDRENFKKIITKLNLKQPKNGIAYNIKDATRIAKEIGYPLLIRPSYVLGGRAMEIVYEEKNLEEYFEYSKSIWTSRHMPEDNPILLDSFLVDAKELDVDLIRDRENNIYISGIMEHIEEAGIHSGDSSCSIPPYSLSIDIMDEIERQSKILASELNIIGIMNIQFAIQNNQIFVLEVNPRASRTVPFVAKSTGVQIAKLATKVIMGKSLKDYNNLVNYRNLSLFSVKEPVFPFKKFQNVDVLRGPEMKSTGEVMGIDNDFYTAFLKSQTAAGINLPKSGTVFLSVKDKDKKKLIPIATKLIELGFDLLGTEGTSAFLKNNNILINRINKISEGSPHVVDFLKANKITLVINTTEGKTSTGDSYIMRRNTLLTNTPYYTTINGADTAIKSIQKLKKSDLQVRSLQSIH
jgi:carbamoyl-phosphate synthase large subunit